jgi:hypothetical protein
MCISQRAGTGRTLIALIIKIICIILEREGLFLPVLALLRILSGRLRLRLKCYGKRVGLSLAPPTQQARSTNFLVSEDFPQSEWPTDGSQPFVWSFNDEVGTGSHGDYVFGWKGDALQKAMDSTPVLSTGLKTQTVDQANKCNIQSSVHEDIDECRLYVSY